MTDMTPTTTGPQSPALPWTAASVIGDGWRALKADPSLILVALLAVILGNAVSWAFSIAAGAAGGDAAPILEIAGSILNLPVQAYITVGWVTYLLAAMRGQKPEIGMILKGGRTLHMIAMFLVYAIAVVLGLALLIVPGVMLLCGWWVATYSLVDRGKGPVECLGDSWALTDGRKWDIFVLAVFQILLTLGGLLACVVGVFATITICALASTALYMRLIGESPVLGAETPGAMPPAPSAAA